MFYCVISVFKGTMFKDIMSKQLYTSIILNKYFNNTAQR